MSLGIGGLAVDCESVESFSSSNPNSPSKRQSVFNKEAGLPDTSKELTILDNQQKVKKQLCAVKFNRSSSSFLRVSDLNLSGSSPRLTMSSSSSSSEIFDDNSSLITESYPNFHHPASDPPPGVLHDPREQWIALDNGNGVHAPIAPFAVEALVQSARHLSGSESKWTPDAKTAKWMDQNHNGWDKCTWRSPNDDINAWKKFPVAESPENERIFVWSTTFGGGGYGSEIPAVRVAGIIPASAEDVMHLLVDSSRVHEYNKLSLGRTDELILQDSLRSDGPFGGITKIMTSETSVLRKSLQFTSLMHVRETDVGYKLVTRAVECPFGSATALKSEILLGINAIWRIPEDDTRCLLITVNHIRSPFVPMMIAKRMGLQAASNFIHDLRQCYLSKKE